MSKWNFVAVREVGRSGSTNEAAGPIARRTGESEANNMALIGAAFLATALIGFLRSVDAVPVAGRICQQPAPTIRAGFDQSVPSAG
jgi:LPXTG-motif cell wall-anchored protein